MYMDAPAFGNQIELAALARFGGVEAIEAAIVKAIVRGEQPVAGLKQTTVTLTARGLTHKDGAPAALFATLTSSDLAEGLLNLRADRAGLVEWARFVLLTSDLFAFDDRHTDYCDRLFGAIWDLAFGAPASEATVRLARSIQHRSKE